MLLWVCSDYRLWGSVKWIGRNKSFRLFIMVQRLQCGEIVVCIPLAYLENLYSQVMMFLKEDMEFLLVTLSPFHRVRRVCQHWMCCCVLGRRCLRYLRVYPHVEVMNIPFGCFLVQDRFRYALTVIHMQQRLSWRRWSQRCWRQELSELVQVLSLVMSCW